MMHKMHLSLGNLFCSVDTGRMERWLSYRIIILLDLNVGSSVLSLLLASILFFIIRKSLGIRKDRGDNSRKRRHSRVLSNTKLCILLYKVYTEYEYYTCMYDTVAVVRRELVTSAYFTPYSVFTPIT